MRLVCATEWWLGKYLAMAKRRDVAFQIWPSRTAILVAYGAELVAGVMVYDSSGPFLFFEHLVTELETPLRVRHRAVSLMADEMMSMCRHFGKLPQIAVKPGSGVEKILERVGLQKPGAVMMTCAFYHLETNDQKPIYASPATRRLSRSAPTEPAPFGDTEEHLGVYASVLGGGERVEA